MLAGPIEIDLLAKCTYTYIWIHMEVHNNNRFIKFVNTSRYAVSVFVSRENSVASP